MQDLWEDVRSGIRIFRKSPFFTVFAVTTIALGVGATTSIYALVEGVLLRPLPFSDPDRLVALWEENPERNWKFNLSAPANQLDWRERVASFEEVTAHGSTGSLALGGDGEPEVVSAVFVSGNFFSVLGVDPELGRGFTMEETWEGASDVVILSYGLWQRRFGGDPSVVGRRVSIEGEPSTILGVAPRGFEFPYRGTDVWVPFGWKAEFRGQVWFRRAHFLWPIARLRSGATLESASAELQAVAAQLAEEYPETNRSMGAGLTPLHEWITGDTRRPLVIVLASVALVLLGGCANLGNLLPARAEARSREMAIRGALGAGRARLVRQLLVESLLLSALGGLLAIAIARASLPLLVASLPEEIPRTTEVSFRESVLAFGVLASVVTALAFGLVPALQASRTFPGIVLRESGRGLTPSRSRLRQTLVASEVALAVILASAGLLLLRSFLSLAAVPAGFDPEGLWTATISVPYAVYDEEEQRRFHSEVLEELRALPGVVSFAAADHLPLTGLHYTTDYLFEGRPPEEAGVEISRRRVSPGYFRTMGVPLLAGREFTDGDTAGAAPVAIINESLRRRYFTTEEPIGNRIAIETEEPRRWITIVGVVGDEKLETLSASSRPEVVFPLFQEDTPPTVRYVFRSSIDPETVTRALRRTVASLDAGVPVHDVGPVGELIGASVARPRFLVSLVASFAALALFLAAFGIYALAANAVAQRKREIGIRMALGAHRIEVIRMITVESIQPVAIGLVLGLAAALLLSGALSGLLYGISAQDPGTLVLVAVATAVLGILSSYLPARLASRVDPARSLHAQ